MLPKNVAILNALAYLSSSDWSGKLVIFITCSCLSHVTSARNVSKGSTLVFRTIEDLLLVTPKYFCFMAFSILLLVVIGSGATFQESKGHITIANVLPVLFVLKVLGICHSTSVLWQDDLYPVNGMGVCLHLFLLSGGNNQHH